jgi:hypothetical protein
VKEHIQVLSASFRDVAALKQSCRASTWVIHSAADLAALLEQDFMTMMLTARATDGRRARDGVERPVMISSTDVYGIPPSSAFETDRLFGVGRRSRQYLG